MVEQQDIVTIQLVQEIEKYACLYDYNIKSYSNDRAKTAAWNDVSKTVNISGNYHYIVCSRYIVRYLLLLIIMFNKLINCTLKTQYSIKIIKTIFAQLSMHLPDRAHINISNLRYHFSILPIA